MSCVNDGYVCKCCGGTIFTYLGATERQPNGIFRQSVFWCPNCGTVYHTVTENEHTTRKVINHLIPELQRTHDAKRRNDSSVTGDDA